MFILDTNVVSELRKVRSGKADVHVAQWADSVDAASLYLSVITLQELEIGVLLAERGDRAQGAALRTRLNSKSLTSTCSTARTAAPPDGVEISYNGLTQTSIHSSKCLI